MKEYEVSNEVWKQTAVSLKTAIDSGALGREKYVSAFDMKSREAYLKIVENAKLWWEGPK